MPIFPAFQAPGAAAMDQLQQMLLQREQQKRQDLLLSIQQRQSDRADQELQLRQQDLQLRQQEEQQRQQQAQQLKAQQTAGQTVADANPQMGDVLSPDLITALRTAGRPGLVDARPGLTSTSTIGGQAPVGSDVPDVSSSSTSTSEALPVFRGTSQQQESQKAADAKRAADAQSYADKVKALHTVSDPNAPWQEKALAAQVLGFKDPKDLIVAPETPEQADARAIKRHAAEARIDHSYDKPAAGVQTPEDVQARISDIDRLTREIAASPGLTNFGATVGSKLGRLGNQNFANTAVKVKQLKGLLTIDKLKANFGGRITNKDIDLVATMVSGFDENTSPDEVRAALNTIRSKVGLDAGNGSAGPASSGRPNDPLGIR
jgi:hypothetical protein